MSLENQSPWAEPAPKPPVTSQQMLEARYPADSEEMDDMVVIQKSAEDVTLADDPFSQGSRVVVKRSNGQLEYNWTVSGTETRTDPTTSKPVEYRIVQKTENGTLLTKALRLSELEAIREKLDDKLRLDLGTEATEAAGVESPLDLGYIEAVHSSVDGLSEGAVEGEIIDPFDALPKGVQDEVTRYKNAVQSKVDAEKSKDFAGAADAGRWIYEVGKSISPQAQEFVGFKR
ncbi:MAG: hypothetical protein JWN26_605 [Candidatus Saccharibacteria bacterium]|nr:hypothetical protein [Candidatus Saccharibacteria bacterium]